MQAVWKYDLPMIDEPVIRMPKGARLLYVDMQGNKPCVWALVVPTEAVVDHKFTLVGTGHPVPENMDHVGTFQQGQFVWHLFGPMLRQIASGGRGDEEGSTT